MKHTEFYLNMNGNSRNQLVEQYMDICDAIQDLKTALAKADMWDGRNSIDSNHRNQLNEQKLYLFSLLEDVEKGVEQTCEPLKR